MFGRVDAVLERDAVLEWPTRLLSDELPSHFERVRPLEYPSAWLRPLEPRTARIHRVAGDADTVPTTRAFEAWTTRVADLLMRPAGGLYVRRFSSWTVSDMGTPVENVYGHGGQTENRRAALQTPIPAHRVPFAGSRSRFRA